MREPVFGLYDALMKKYPPQGLDDGIHLLFTALSASPEDTVEAALRRFEEKDQLTRSRTHQALLQHAVYATPRILTGETEAERDAQKLELIRHCEALWDEAVALLNAGAFARSVALAVTCLEELGKVFIAEVQQSAVLPESMSKGKKPFYDHHVKHHIAAGAGALINRRLDQLLGTPRVTRFLGDAETGALESLRKNCLYVDLSPSGFLLPEDRATRDDSLEHIVISGELLVTAAGRHEEELQPLLEKVIRFELLNGFKNPRE